MRVWTWLNCMRVCSVVGRRFKASDAIKFQVTFCCCGRRDPRSRRCMYGAPCSWACHSTSAAWMRGCSCQTCRVPRCDSWPTLARRGSWRRYTATTEWSGREPGSKSGPSAKRSTSCWKWYPGTPLLRSWRSTTYDLSTASMVRTTTVSVVVFPEVLKTQYYVSHSVHWFLKITMVCFERSVLNFQNVIMRFVQSVPVSRKMAAAFLQSVGRFTAETNSCMPSFFQNSYWYCENMKFRLAQCKIWSRNCSNTLRFEF